MALDFLLISILSNEIIKVKKHFVQGHLHISDTLCQNIYCEVWNLRYFTSSISAFVQTSIICLTERNAMAQWGFIIRTKH